MGIPIADRHRDCDHLGKLSGLADDVCHRSCESVSTSGKLPDARIPNFAYGRGHLGGRFTRRQKNWPRKFSLALTWCVRRRVCARYGTPVDGLCGALRYDTSDARITSDRHPSLPVPEDKRRRSPKPLRIGRLKPTRRHPPHRILAARRARFHLPFPAAAASRSNASACDGSCVLNFPSRSWVPAMPPQADRHFPAASFR